MGWAVGEDTRFGMERDIGYGVPAICDHPGCGKPIDRGLGYVCGDDVYGGEDGCGLFFCGEHLAMQLKEDCLGTEDEDWTKFICERCRNDEPHFDLTPDTHEWIMHKAIHSSWKTWRKENPAWCWANVTLGFWLVRQYWAIWDAGRWFWEPGFVWRVRVKWSQVRRKMGF